MKKFGIAVSALLVLTLFFGMWLKDARRLKEYSKTEFLFDTECRVKAYGKNAEVAVDAVFDELAQIHKTTDVYSDDSQISKINSASAGERVKVEPFVAEIIAVAYDVYLESDGAFDITLAPVTALWNFGTENPEPPEGAAIEKALCETGFDNIVLDRENFTVTKKRASAKIDLGGAVKGYAANRAAEILRTFDTDGAVVDLGGNIICVGKNPNTSDGLWRIGIQKPFSPTGEYGSVEVLSEEAAVTSGTYQRCFEYGGKLYHHILDPKCGYPAQREYASVTIVSDDALLADCLATACFVLGEEEGTRLAEKYGARIIYTAK